MADVHLLGEVDAADIDSDGLGRGGCRQAEFMGQRDALRVGARGGHGAADRSRLPGRICRTGSIGAVMRFDTLLEHLHETRRADDDVREVARLDIGQRVELPVAPADETDARVLPEPAGRGADPEDGGPGGGGGFA